MFIPHVDPHHVLPREHLVAHGALHTSVGVYGGHVSPHGVAGAAAAATQRAGVWEDALVAATMALQVVRRGEPHMADFTLVRLHRRLQTDKSSITIGY